jgi:AraC-like DNA-binding protein
MAGQQCASPLATLTGVEWLEARESAENLCSLLLDPNLPITEIALDCGFADVSTFNRTFRRLKGMPPSGYRAQMRKLCRLDEP